VTLEWCPGGIDLAGDGQPFPGGWNGSRRGESDIAAAKSEFAADRSEFADDKTVPVDGSSDLSSSGFELPGRPTR
jgi:hypothetical protein